jgi:hypothetical protein
MTGYTTLRGMDIQYMIDLVDVLVYYGDVYCGYVESQTISGGKIDFTICWETGEIAEMMQDKLTTAKISIRTVELGTNQEDDDE